MENWTIRSGILAASCDVAAASRGNGGDPSPMIVDRPGKSDECSRRGNVDIPQATSIDALHALMVAREVRMAELKREINVLCSRLGEPPRYGVEAQLPQAWLSPKS